MTLCGQKETMRMMKGNGKGGGTTQGDSGSVSVVVRTSLAASGEAKKEAGCRGRQELPRVGAGLGTSAGPMPAKSNQLQPGADGDDAECPFRGRAAAAWPASA